jgi:selenocysteine-specific elongation factor
VAIDQSLAVLPRRRVVKVRGLQVHGRPQVAAEAGRRVAINLGGVDVSELARGDTLADGDAFEPTRRLDTRLDLLPDARPLRQGARVRFHCGTVEVLGRVGLAEPQPGAVYARIHLESPAIVTRGDRFILRAYSPLATIGGGVVLDPRPPRASIRSATGVERVRQLDTGTLDDDGAVTAFVNEAGGAGLPRSALVSRAGLSYRKADAAVTRLTKSGAATLVGSLLVSPRACTELGERLLAALRAHHETHPHAGGMPREEARERFFRRVAPEIFAAVLEGLVAAHRLVARDRLALAGQGVSLSDAETRAQEALERVYRGAGLTPPDLATAAAAAGTALAVAERMVLLLVRARALVKLDALLFHSAVLEGLKDDIRRTKDEPGGGRVDVASFKARFGITRKYAIPLLEYLDRERVTRRIG